LQVAQGKQVPLLSIAVRAFLPKVANWPSPGPMRRILKRRGNSHRLPIAFLI
jgi:hypothetical protein